MRSPGTAPEAGAAPSSRSSPVSIASRFPPPALADGCSSCATARRFGVINRVGARQNIFGGTRYLRALLDHYRGDVSLTAAAYNAGVSCVARYHGIPPYKQTQDYVRKVNVILGTAREEAVGGEGREGGLGGKG